MNKEGNEFVDGTIKSLKNHNMTMDIMNSTEAKSRFPMISFPDDFTFVLDHSGGILRADKALKAFQVRHHTYSMLKPYRLKGILIKGILQYIDKTNSIIY